MAFVFLQQSGRRHRPGRPLPHRHRLRPGIGGTRHHPGRDEGLRGPPELSPPNSSTCTPAPEAVLEYLPDPVVPFRGSRLFQRTCLTVDPRVDRDPRRDAAARARRTRRDARLRPLLGRNRGSRSRTGRCCSPTPCVCSPADGTIPNSIGLARPPTTSSQHCTSSPARLDPRRRRRAAACRALTARPDVLVGVSELPNNCGASVRLLGPDSSRTGRATCSMERRACRARRTPRRIFVRDNAYP